MVYLDVDVDECNNGVSDASGPIKLNTEDWYGN